VFTHDVLMLVPSAKHEVKNSKTALSSLSLVAFTAAITLPPMFEIILTFHKSNVRSR